MIEQTITRCAEYLQSARTRWKWVGRGLTIAASLYIIVLVVYSGFQIAEINWRLYWQAALIPFPTVGKLRRWWICRQ